jgi:Enoyl-(Acyl carrier protein) reductase
LIFDHVVRNPVLAERGEKGARAPAKIVLEAAEFGVRVNVVAPGPIDTGMLTNFIGTAERKAGLVAGVPFQRMGKPDEIAQMILFLASDKASFRTPLDFQPGYLLSHVWIPESFGRAWHLPGCAARLRTELQCETKSSYGH